MRERIQSSTTRSRHEAALSAQHRGQRPRYEGGEVYDVASEERAQYFLKHGMAEAVAEAPQAAVLADETERATLPKAQRRGP